MSQHEVKSSNSSLQLRQHLKNHFVIVPPIASNVSLKARYIPLCEMLYRIAEEKYKKNDLSACRSAYVDFHKFQILALEQIPRHRDYDQLDVATKKWIKYIVFICSN